MKEPQSAQETFGWHFIPSDRRLAHGDGRLVVDGETLSVDGKIVMCRNGLHLSERAVDAFAYGSLPVVCWVAGSGYSERGSDKSAFRSRRCVWSADATQVLVRFAAWCAERAKMHAASASASASAAYSASAAAYAAAYASASANAADSYAAASAAYASASAAYADADTAYSAAFAAADAAYVYAAASAAAYAAAAAAYAAEREAQNECLTDALWELAPAGHRRAIA